MVNRISRIGYRRLLIRCTCTRGYESQISKEIDVALPYFRQSGTFFPFFFARSLAPTFNSDHSIMLMQLQ